MTKSSFSGLEFGVIVWVKPGFGKGISYGNFGVVRLSWKYCNNQIYKKKSNFDLFVYE